jgi:energy-converting hydrogenase Eha subunit F
MNGYRNGVQFGDTVVLTGTPVFPSINSIKYTSAYYGSTAYSIVDGSLDEVRIYNRGLSAEEVSQHYTSTKGKFGL